MMPLPLRVARRYHEAWNRHDPGAVRALFIDAGEIVDPRVRRTVRGDAIVAYCRGILKHYPDLVFDLEGAPVVTGVTVATQWIARATDPRRGGARVTGRGAEFLWIEGDKLRAARVYLDGTLSEAQEPAPRRGSAAASRKYRRSRLSEEEARLAAERIRSLLSEHHLYRDPDLGLAELSAAVGASTNHVSQVINTLFGASFNQLVSRHRVEEAKRLLSDPERPKRSVLEAGLEAGFAAKSTFYTAFKQHTQMTPEAWARKRHDGAPGTESDPIGSDDRSEERS
jgi:AraC-like DNA-binding protein